MLHQLHDFRTNHAFPCIVMLNSFISYANHQNQQMHFTYIVLISLRKLYSCTAINHIAIDKTFRIFRFNSTIKNFLHTSVNVFNTTQVNLRKMKRHWAFIKCRPNTTHLSISLKVVSLYDYKERYTDDFQCASSGWCLNRPLYT